MLLHAYLLIVARTSSGLTSRKYYGDALNSNSSSDTSLSSTSWSQLSCLPNESSCHCNSCRDSTRQDKTRRGILDCKTVKKFPLSLLDRSSSSEVNMHLHYISCSETDEAYEIMSVTIFFVRTVVTDSLLSSRTSKKKTRVPIGWQAYTYKSLCIFCNWMLSRRSLLMWVCHSKFRLIVHPYPAHTSRLHPSVLSCTRVVRHASYVSSSNNQWTLPRQWIDTSPIPKRERYFERLTTKHVV